MKKRTSNTDDVPLKSLLFACLSTRQDLGLVIFVFGHPSSFLSSFAGERKMGFFFAILSVLLSISSQKIDRRHPHPTATLSTSSLCPYPPFISKRLLTPLLRRFGWQNIIKMQIGSSFPTPILLSQIPSNSV